MPTQGQAVVDTAAEETDRACYRADPAAFSRHAASQASVMRHIAAELCCTGTQHAHLGRGPHAYDDVGLVYVCLQAAIDWRAWSEARVRVGWAPGPRLADPRDYPPGKLDPNAAAEFLARAGLLRVACQNPAKSALPGDVMVYIGPGPRMGVVMAPWRTAARFPNFESPATAYVWAGRPPATLREARLGWMPLALFRWPEAA